MKVYEELGGGFYCFSCCRGGSIINFVMGYFKIEYLDALKKLDADFGLNILDEPEDKATSRRYNSRHGLIKIQKKRKDMSLDSMIKLYCKYHQAIKNEEPMSDLFCEALYHIADLEYRINTIMDGEG